MKKISSDAVTDGRPVIHYPRFDQLRDQLVMCIDRTQETGEPHCMALEGQSGAGKTTLVKTFVDAFPRSDETFGVRIPVLYVLTPAPITIKGMAAKILAALGDPHTADRQQWRMDQRIINFIRGCEVELIILDEIQHLIDPRRSTFLAVTEWLKALIKQTNVAFVIVGLEGEVEPILEGNRQLARLFATRSKLEPFQIQTPDQKKEYLRFLTYTLEQQGLPLSAEIEFADFALRLYHVSGGLAAKIVNLVGDAAYLAKKQGHKEIGKEVLKAAHAQRRGQGGQADAFDFSREFAPSRPRSSATKPGNKNSKTPSASEVLKAKG